MNAPYTHTNIDEVEDVAPKFGLEHGESRFLGEPLEAKLVGLSHYRVKAGKRFGFGHRHDLAEEVYVVLEGDGRLKLDDDILELATLDVIRVSPTVVREFEAGPGGLVFLATGNHVKGDGELIQDWWTD